MLPRYAYALRKRRAVKKTGNATYVGISDKISKTQIFLQIRNLSRSNLCIQRARLTDAVLVVGGRFVVGAGRRSGVRLHTAVR